MKLADYSYELPRNRIAQYPPKVRGNAKLLVLHRGGRLEDRAYADFVDYVQTKDVVVLNNTKVIKARLLGLGSDGKARELVLLEKHSKSEDKFHHKAIFRGKLTAGMSIAVGDKDIEVVGVYSDSTALLACDIDFMELAKKFGHVPLPPYMKRQDTHEDVLRYQTEFSKTVGSVAAPTASLNMTNQLIAKLKNKGVVVCEITLHVGLGTFLPIRETNITKHHMHSEWYEIPKQTVEAIQSAKAEGSKIFAVGTTVARTLEYAASCYPEFISGSRFRTKLGMTTKALGDDNKGLSGEADIFIYPGYGFKVVDALLTNFHAPKSTVLMMAAAFVRSTDSEPKVGWEYLLKAYQHASANQYKFLSYGDSMLIVD